MDDETFLNDVGVRGLPDLMEYIRNRVKKDREGMG